MTKAAPEGFEEGRARGRSEGYAAALAEIAARAEKLDQANGVAPDEAVGETGDVRPTETSDAERSDGEDPLAKDALAPKPLDAAADGDSKDAGEEIADAETPDEQASEDQTADADARAEAKARAEAETERLAEIERAFNEIKEGGVGDGALEQITMKLTPAGLVIEIADADGEPLFSSGSARPSPRLADLVAIVAPVINELENAVEVVGHTDGAKFGPNSTYTNWDLSSDRANAARRVLDQLGVKDDRIARVAGAADRNPISDDPLAPQNRRIAITLLRSAVETIAPLSP